MILLVIFLWSQCSYNLSILINRSPIEENDFIDKGNDLPNRLIQQQLLLLNSLSNRLTWLFTELSQNGISDQITRPHENALNRMINASRDLQVKLQKNLRRVATSPIHRIDSTNIITTQEMEDLEKEKKRLEDKLSVVNDKLTFFSNEYQRITELYINEKSKNEQYVLSLLISRLMYRRIK